MRYFLAKSPEFEIGHAGQDLNVESEVFHQIFWRQILQSKAVLFVRVQSVIHHPLGVSDHAL